VPVDRPTFSESWYRVADLRPRLRPTVQMHRQHFRGQTWHVVQDPASNQFFRLNEEAYRFVALLDGRRSVSEAWKITNEQAGDAAPTQGEAIQLLGQLYTSNLLQGDLPPDAEGLLKRYRQRITREVQGYLTNLLFIRIPVLDPDRFLDKTVALFGKVFTGWGLAVWLALMGTGLYFVTGRTRELADAARSILDPKGLPLLYAAMVFIKVVHEFGHAFACKKFGRESGSGGEVHIMGIMFLVFTPLPYMDASSSWAFRRKWHRIVVGAAGMFVELAVAAVAAVVWARTGEGTTIHALAYNLIFIGSVSTILFNANPLLRYDGYYMLSDLLEIPNLAQRSKEYIYYLVRRWVWSVRQARSPAHTRGERVWLAAYGVSSFAYRVIISVAILVFISSRLPFLGVLLAVAAVVAWVIVPIGKFVHYLTSGSELMRVRTRAILTSLAAPAVVVAALGLIPAPDRVYVGGVVEPVRVAIVHAGADGFLAGHLPSGRTVAPDGQPLLVSQNPELEAEAKTWAAERQVLLSRRDLARSKETELPTVQILDGQIRAVDEKIDRVRQRLADLQVRAPFAGVWLAPDLDLHQGAYLKRGQRVGVVATLGDVLIRAVAGQDVAGRLGVEVGVGEHVEMRVDGRPDAQVTGTIKQFLPAGSDRLPSAALGYAGGGPIAVTTEDQQGTKAAERVFEIQITPDPSSDVRLLAGQRVVIRFEASRKPLLAQWWRAALQLFQRRFKV
jgi:putative peptide zinc metalloprotease protein